MRSEKFDKLYEFYESLPGRDRRGNYEKAEIEYEKKYGERAYSSFEIFHARLSMYFTEKSEFSGTRPV